MCDDCFGGKGSPEELAGESKATATKAAERKRRSDQQRRAYMREYQRKYRATHHAERRQYMESYRELGREVER